MTTINEFVKTAKELNTKYDIDAISEMQQATELIKSYTGTLRHHTKGYDYLYLKRVELAKNLVEFKQEYEGLKQ